MKLWCSWLLLGASLSACSFRVGAVPLTPSDAADLAIGSPSPNPSPDDLATIAAALDLSTVPLLTGSHADIPATIGLTAEGALDWLHAGLAQSTDVNHKNNVAPLLTLTTSVAAGQFGNYTPKYTWSDGTPTVSAMTSGGIYINGQNNGFTLTLPTAATTRTVIVYVTGFNAHCKLTAHLSDGAVADYSDTQTIGGGNVFYKYTIAVRDAAPNARLTITWTLVQPGNGYSSVDFMAATVQ